MISQTSVWYIFLDQLGYPHFRTTSEQLNNVFVMDLSHNDYLIQELLTFVNLLPLAPSLSISAYSFLFSRITHRNLHIIGIILILYISLQMYDRGLMILERCGCSPPFCFFHCILIEENISSNIMITIMVTNASQASDHLQETSN